MLSKSRKIHRIQNVIFSFLFWFVLALLFASNMYLNYQAKDENVAFGIELLWQLSCWLPWFFLMPVILYLSRAIQVERLGWSKAILIHTPISLFLTVLKVFIYYIFSLPLRSTITPTFFYTQFTDVLQANYIFELIIYWCILISIYGINYYRNSKKQQLRASQLESQLARSQLQMLKMQLHPHFLFNTLHTISTLIHKDADLADRMIMQLSDLLRTTLDNSDAQTVPLKEELTFLKNYLEIVRIRFQDRLDIVVDAERATLKATVPNLILQPLVENAIKHGVLPFSKAGKIVIKTRKNNGQLSIEVCDNGPGIEFSKLEHIKKGIGLTNTVERLSKLYGNTYHFEMKNGENGGLTVRIEIPFEITTET